MRVLSALGRKAKTDELPLLPLRELVLFPHTMVPVFVSQKEAVAALEEAIKRDRRVFAACRRPAAVEGAEGVPAQVGTVARVVQELKLPDGTWRVLLEGEFRARSGEPSGNGNLRLVQIQAVGAPETPGDDAETAALIRAVQKSFVQYSELSKKVNADALAAAERASSAERLVNLVGHAAAVKAERKIELLALENPKKRLAAVLDLLEYENEIIGIQKKITGKVKTRMDKTQREYILNEQLKEINKELGKDAEQDEFQELERAIAARRPGDEVLAKAAKELGRLRKLQPLSPEAGVIRGYLEWLADLPWSERTEDSHDLAAAEHILDEDHFDMRQAKDRIVEYIAVRQLTETIKGPILCFVGPPGTGKTSLGRSVARALGRRFVRISLGGVRDEAEIRGHRKTYVGALPGKIIQSMRKAGTANPVFLLDEIDKLSSDFRGDPASALLEVLDPEQNNSFSDHYLEVPFDLSKVLFIATANSLHTIPYPLLDRMEIIEVPGYGEREKLEISRKYLIPKEIAENGLADAKLRITDEAVLDIVRFWTMESGVRSLEREIARCVRRLGRDAVAKGYGRAEGDKALPGYRRTVKPSDLEKLLGRRKHRPDLVFTDSRIGVVNGLAWTETGGTLLPVETVRLAGSGELILTGNLGDVMKESARTALSYLRSVWDRYPMKLADPTKADFHIHVPEGAIPKDGPSAGIALAAALLSALCAEPPKPGVAMTGEISLTGRVLAIGGLKEKLLAAIRNGMTDAVVPKANADAVAELPEDLRKALRISYVETVDEAFRQIFGPGAFRETAGATEPAAPAAGSAPAADAPARD
jgi:ATP-dependent Lon protease